MSQPLRNSIGPPVGILEQQELTLLQSMFQLEVGQEPAVIHCVCIMGGMEQAQFPILEI